ncbi:MAG: 4'-phosphopantetheinyl transferase superfamily protein [Fermentimonas sp.]|nr:4'-phosphopantetheinyl transferase superfamily protein [Fermentimonas sp.]
MLIRKDYSVDGSLMGIWKMDETIEELLELFPPTLRSEANNYINSLRSKRRITEWLCTRIMLFELLGETKIIQNREDGKPYLADSSYNISISHTRNHAAIILNKSFPVGIDIEIKSDRVEKLAYKFVSEKEHIDPEQKILHQLLHWSVKECMFKLINEQGIDFKKHLLIHRFTPEQNGVITATEFRTAENRTYNLNYEVHPEYVLTWVVDTE